MDIRIICIAALLLATNTALPADIKQWKDENGQVHFGDYAPPDVNATEVTPEIITTAPSANNSLKDVMRPGELRLIKDRDERVKRQIKAEEKALKRAKIMEKRAAKAKKMCAYHQSKIDSLRRKLRAGCTRPVKNKLEESLAMHNLQAEEYCN